MLQYLSSIWCDLCHTSVPECPAGSFGPGCKHRCQCENQASCDHVGGACTCKIGWTGTFCEKCTVWLFHLTSVTLWDTDDQIFDCMRVCVCVQLVRRVSMVWIVSRSVRVWTGVSVIMSVVNAPVGLAGSVHTVTNVSLFFSFCSILSSRFATVPLRLLCVKDVWCLANFFTCEIDKQKGF